jgi:hypothetical protein
MADPEWHGFARDEPLASALHVGRMPGRKSVCLYIARRNQHENGIGCEVEPLAYFRSDEAAREALALLDHLIPTRPQEP